MYKHLNHKREREHKRTPTHSYVHIHMCTQHWRQIINVNKNPCVIYNGYGKTINKSRSFFFFWEINYRKAKFKKKTVINSWHGQNCFSISVLLFNWFLRIKKIAVL